MDSVPDNDEGRDAMGSGHDKERDKIGSNVTDEDLDEMIEAMGTMQNPDDEGKTIDEMIEELETHPAFMKEWDPNKPLTADMEGMMRLKYECEDPVAKAEAYKDDGNHEFKKKKYRVAIDNYTEGIVCRCPDKLLNAILYTNRAAAQFHIQNYRTAMNDCIFARKFQPEHVKAIHRGAMCNLQMKKYEECLKWCDDALILDPNNVKMQEIRQQATKVKKSIERDKRKEKLQEKKEFSEEMRLIQAIQKREIKLAGIKQTSSGDQVLNPALLTTSIETHNPHGVRVHLDTNNILYWPVMFLYPEYAETDYIQMFCENQRFIDHLSHVFGVEREPANWDKGGQYKAHALNVHFEDKVKKKLHKVNKESSLLKVLQHKRYIIHGGTPAFIITVAGSEFEKDFLRKYKD